MDGNCVAAATRQLMAYLRFAVDGPTVSLNLRSNKAPRMQPLSSLMLPWEKQEGQCRRGSGGASSAVSDNKKAVCIADIVNRR